MFDVLDRQRCLGGYGMGLVVGHAFKLDGQFQLVLILPAKSPIRVNHNVELVVAVVES